jgi:hypothetical protein
MNGELIAIFRHAHEIIDVGNIQHRINTLRAHIRGKGDEVDIGSLNLLLFVTELPLNFAFAKLISSL